MNTKFSSLFKGLKKLNFYRLIPQLQFDSVEILQVL